MGQADRFNHRAAQRFTRLTAEELSGVQSGGRGTFGFVKVLRSILGRRELLGQLVRRELVGRYKGSALGFVWTLIRPLSQLLIYYLVIGQFLGAARMIENFAVYIFAGLTLWALFSEAVQTMTASILNNAGLVKKVYLPREIFPLAALGSSLFNFVVQFAILIVAAGLVGTLMLGWHLLFAVAATGVVIIYALAFGLILAATNVYLRDVQYLVEVLLMIFMWMSPIVYSWQMVETAFGPGSLLTDAYVNNPMTLAVLGFQAAIWAPHSGDVIFPDYLAARLVIAAVVGVIFVWLSQRIFSRLQGNFAQEL